MPKLTVGGRKVTIGDEFLSLSPQEQEATVEEISKSFGGANEGTAGTSWAEVGDRAIKNAPGSALNAGEMLGSYALPWVGGVQVGSQMGQDPAGAVQGAVDHVGKYLSDEGRKELIAERPFETAVEVGSLLTPGIKGVGKILPKAKVPLPKGRVAKDAFKESGALYDQLHSLGPYDPGATKGIAPAMDSALKAGRFSPERQSKAYSVLKDLGTELERDGATPGTLENWRKVIKRDLLNSPDGDLRDAGFEMMDTLDNFVNSEVGGPAAKAARSTFRKAVQADRLEFAIRQAERTAERGGKNFTHHLATQLQKLVTADERAIQKGRPPQFDEATRKRLDKIASERGGKMLDWIGNLSPDRRIGMMLNALGLGAAIPTGGWSLVLQGATGVGSYAAKKASERSGRAAVETLRNELLQ
jgi:hypothetical protein